MTTGHFNPGYGDIISTLRRAKSAGPGMAVGSKSFRETVDYRSDPLLLEHIRSQARETWSKPSVFQTSYDDQFNNKIVEMGEATRARPTSTQRRNKPHPPLVFLTNRLHDIPGFLNPDATVGNEVYRVDASVHPLEQYERGRMRGKPPGRPETGAIRQYRDSGLENNLSPRDAIAVKAFKTITNSNDGEDVQRLLNRLQDQKRQEEMEQSRIEPRPIASLHRYGRLAGYKESRAISRLQRGDGYYDQEPYELKPPGPGRPSLNIQRLGYPHPVTGPPNQNIPFLISGTLGSRKEEDVSKVHNMRYTGTGISVRGDYLLHPDWPPTIPHQSLPSVC